MEAAVAVEELELAELPPLLLEACTVPIRYSSQRAYTNAARMEK